MKPISKEYKEKLEQSIIESDVVKIFDYLLTVAVEEEASDIHIEPLETYCRIRIRIDGLLEELVQYPKNLHESIISKFKIESGQMRPDEKRIPQDARVSTTTQTNKEIDLRANTLPTVLWEKLVMRIVDKSKKIPPLEKLGIEWTNKDIIYKTLKYPNGIILSTWPTGSGKTTTLYACLDVVNKADVNIITYEDPVEIKRMWLNQAQVRNDIWFNFAAGLRGAVRQDPDIIMVWEIRDMETLETSMEAAMTWHLVFSTIHTNSAAETITRVYKFGAEPYMLAWTFNLVMAQRLVRTICPNCKAEKNISEEAQYQASKKSFNNFDKDKLKIEIVSRWITQEQRDKFIKNGIVTYWTWKDPQTKETCKVCGWKGYKWRTGIYEFMHYNDELKNIILEWKSAFEIEKYALQKWMINLERDWIFKVMKWITTLEQIYRFVKPK